MDKSNRSANGKKECFVIMPISDPGGYKDGHFKRVYEHIIKPACKKAGFNAVRADDPMNSSVIMVDVLRRIVEADIAVCDLSSRNPNVLYELGIRQAFDLPVVLIMDTKTERIFDIAGIRSLSYEENLRVDTVPKNIDELTTALNETLSKHDRDGGSLIRLLSISRSELSATEEPSRDTALLLEALGDVSARITNLETKHRVPEYGATIEYLSGEGLLEFKLGSTGIIYSLSLRKSFNSKSVVILPGEVTGTIKRIEEGFFTEESRTEVLNSLRENPVLLELEDGRHLWLKISIIKNTSLSDMVHVTAMCT